MKKMKHKLLAVLTAGLLASPAIAHAEYVITLFDYPGATSTSLFGINSRGQVVGGAVVSPNVYPFVLDSTKGTITNLSTVPGNNNTIVAGINDQGETVGGAVNGDDFTEVAYIRSKDGVFTFFSNPNAVSQTEARGINETGLVTGYLDTFDGTAGFVYDSGNLSFEDFAPSLFTLPHGINNRGEIVGSSLFFSENDPCQGAPAGASIFQYGLYRAANGSITYFQVNGQRTRGRGINDSGLIVGDVFDPASGRTKVFIAQLQGLPCESLTIPDSELLSLPGYGLIPEGITNSGVIVGIALNPAFHGFIATRH
jgi:uncharacterized membrane protein